jgi:hypothetical protein
MPSMAPPMAHAEMPEPSMEKPQVEVPAQVQP